jgi:hypothetical protein
MKRRGFLALGVGIASSGCLGGDDESRKRIVWTRLVNDRAEVYDVAVVIESGDEDVFTDEYHLGTGPGSSTVLVDVPLEERDRYVIRFLADGQWVHVYPEEYDDVTESCIGVQFELSREGTRGYEIRRSTGC